MNIEKQSVTVITRSKIRVGAVDLFLDLAKRSNPIFKRQKGFVGLALHLSKDRTEAVTYLQFHSLKDHEDCLKSPDFAEINPAWEKMMKNGEIQFSYQTYEVIETS
jgi:heme-degrading monooxygenase HmoA